MCVLSGPNGSGKSSLLQALQFLRTAMLRGVREAVRLTGGGALLRRLGAEPKAPVHLELCIGDLRWEIQIPVEGGSVHPKPDEVIEHGGKVLARRAMYSDEVFLGDKQRWADERSVLRMLWDAHNPQEILPLVELVRGIRVYSSYCLDEIREPQLYTDDVYLNPSGKNAWSVLSNWRGAPRKYGDQFRWVVHALQRAFPDLVEDLELDIEGRTVGGRFYPPTARSADDSLPLNLAADGLLVGILHLTAIAGAKAGSIVAIDEMENQLHPHAIRSILDSMREMAESRDLTVLLTTHSPVVMNTFKGLEDQFYVLEAGHDVLPVPLDEVLDPDWLAHFSSLGSLYDREEFAAPAHAAPATETE